MRTISRSAVLSALVLSIGRPAPAQEKPLPPADRTPVLRVNPGGPSAPVPCVAVSPDGSTVYVAGLDKLVRVYARKDGKFAEAAPLRVPLGPGNAGAVNAVAVSPDGNWVAVGGRSPMRDEAKFSEDGLMVDTRRIPPDMRRDLGVIYLFDRTNPNGGKVLRGNLGEVRSLAFANPSPAAGPVVVSASTEFDEKGKRSGHVRTWDAKTGTELDARSGFPGSTTRPGLAAWPNAAGKVRVAASWPEVDPKDDGALFMWDVGQKKAESFAVGGWNLGLAVRQGKAGPADLISTGFVNLGVAGRPQYGQLVVRPANGGEERTIKFPFADGKHFLPLAVLPVGDGYAVLFETAPPEAGNPRPAVLRLLSADGSVRGEAVIAKLSPAFLPSLAASADGKTLAVAGFDDHRVEVLDTAALAVGKEASQRLPGAVGGFRRVHFVAGNRLWLQARGDELDGGTVFDLTNRTVAEKAAGDKLDAPAVPANLALSPADKDANEWTLTGGDTTLATVKLRPRERPTAYGYLPAGPAWNKNAPAVVAVAHTNPEDAVHLVTLFDAKSGKAVRSLAGPEQPVRWLAFSASRPLLAAVGDDPVASVWSIKDLDKQVGFLEGVEFVDRGEGPVVTAIDPRVKGIPEGLKVGDIVEAVGGEKGELAAIKSLPGLFWDVRSRPVGGKVGVRVKGNANRLLLPVGHGVEQRNPLFSLWIAPPGNGARPGEREWVGWSPHGPYDASSPVAEAKIGWVTMTGDPANPVTYAGADQYRKTYYRKDVLRFLAEKGELAAAIDSHTDEYPPPPPKLRVRVEGEVPQQAGLPLLRAKSAALGINLSDVTDDFPLERAVVRWRAVTPDGKPGAWKEVAVAGQDRTFTVDIGDHPWSRGTHAFEVALHRTPTSPPATAAVSEVNFVPTAPTVAALVGGKPAEAVVTTEANTVAVSAKVELGTGGPADVVLDWTGPGGEKGSTPLSDKPSELKLTPGTTTVRLTATTRDAGKFAKLESGVTEFQVRYTPEKIPLPPQIAKFEVSTPTEPQAIGKKSILVTDVAKFDLSTTFEAADPITDVEWDDGDGTWHAEKHVAAKKLADARHITLTAGKPTTVRVRAKSGKGPFAERDITLAYHPALPAVSIAPIEVGTSVTTRLLSLTGDFQPVGEDPFKLQVVVTPAGGGDAVSVDAVLNPAAKTWSATVALRPGVNRIGLVVKNDWRSDSFANLATVAFRQPPRVFAVAPADAGESAVADVSATVVTAADFPPTDAIVNGRIVEAAAPKKLGSAFGLVFWQVTAPAVPIKSGNDWAESLRFAVRNADGDSPVSVVPVKRKVRAIPPPIVAVADGTRDRATDQPKIPVRFKVASESKLARVEVWLAPRGGDLERAGSVAPEKFVAGPDGVSVTAEVPLELRPGVNRVRVLAVNDGGETAQEFAVSYTPPAFRVVVDAVEELLPGGAVSDPLKVADDAYQSKAGLVQVRGRVKWTAEDTQTARDPKLSVVLIVNDLEHVPVTLDPQQGRAMERTFKVPMFLSAAQSVVRFAFRSPARDAAAPQQSADTATFRIRCESPLTEQRLHLVVVGVDEPAAKRGELGKRVVTALGGVIPAGREDGFDRGEFTHKAFAKAVLYPPLVGEVDDGKVAWVLDEVNRELKRLGTAKPGAKAGAWLNDVILLYYQGKDWVAPDGRRWLHTSRSQRYSEAAATRFAIRVDGLPTTPGVRLVVLNDLQHAPDKPKVPESTIAKAEGPPTIWFGWKDLSSRERWFAIIRRAIAEQSSVGGVFDLTGKLIADDPEKAGVQQAYMRGEVRNRPLGVGGKPANP